MYAQVIQKAHHAVLAYGIYVDDCKEWSKNPANKQTCIGFKKFFVYKYNDLKLTYNMSAVQIGYQIPNDVVPNGDITSDLDNLSMATTADQSHADQLMATIFQLKDTNKILGE